MGSMKAPQLAFRTASVPSSTDSQGDEMSGHIIRGKAGSALPGRVDLVNSWLCQLPHRASPRLANGGLAQHTHLSQGCHLLDPGHADVHYVFMLIRSAAYSFTLQQQGHIPYSSCDTTILWNREQLFFLSFFLSFFLCSALESVRAFRVVDHSWWRSRLLGSFWRTKLEALILEDAACAAGFGNANDL